MSTASAMVSNVTAETAFMQRDYPRDLPCIVRAPDDDRTSEGSIWKRTIMDDFLASHATNIPKSISMAAEL